MQAEIFRCLISCGADGWFLWLRAWDVMSYSLRPIIGSVGPIPNSMECWSLYGGRKGHCACSRWWRWWQPAACPWLPVSVGAALLSGLLSALHRRISTVHYSSTAISDGVLLVYLSLLWCLQYIVIRMNVLPFPSPLKQGLPAWNGIAQVYLNGL